MYHFHYDKTLTWKEEIPTEGREWLIILVLKADKDKRLPSNDRAISLASCLEILWSLEKHKSSFVVL